MGAAVLKETGIGIKFIDIDNSVNLDQNKMFKGIIPGSILFVLNLHYQYCTVASSDWPALCPPSGNKSDERRSSAERLHGR